MYYLLINPIGETLDICIFDENKKIYFKECKEVKQSEFQLFLTFLEEVLGKASLSWEQIKGIAAIVWPWSFTGMRIITLTLNTIAYVKKIPLEGLHYFDFLQKSGSSYPFLLWANRQESLIKENEKMEAHLIKNEEVPFGVYSGYLDKAIFVNIPCVNSEVLYDVFLSNHTFLWQEKRLAPLYIKKPNIT